MPRAGGKSPTYEWVLRNKSTGRYDKDCVIELPSVTSVVHTVLAAPELLQWTYRVTKDNISGAVSVLRNEYEPERILDILTDPDILEEFLANNRLRPQDIKEEAGERGIEAHAFLERLAKAQLEGDTDADMLLATRTSGSDNPFLHAIADWWLIREPKVLQSEKVVRSLRHGFCGTPDLVLSDEIIDLKTRAAGRGAYVSDFIQVGGYQIAWEEMYPEKAILRRSVLIAQEDGIWISSESPMDKKLFLDLLAVYKKLQNERK